MALKLHSRAPGWVRPALLLIAVAASQPANAITVVVNGQTLPSSPPPVERAGRVLLPMRMIFEVLGAEVKWEAVTQTAIGIRGDTTVRMSIGDRRAWINDRTVMLDVAPQLIGESTYMPVRFPAEAYGADVRYLATTQTVEISLPPLEKPPPPPSEAGTGGPPPPPPPPPPPQPGTVTGVVQAVRTTGGLSLALKVQDDLVAYNVTEDTLILRQGRQATLGELEPGDLAEVRHDGRQKAIVIRATYEEVSGKLAAKAGNKLLLDDGRLFVLLPTVAVVGPDGEELKLADVEAGQEVELRITPGTDAVIRVTLQRPPPPPPAGQAGPQAPAIDLFFHEADKPLKAGSVLKVTLVGTPKGRAWFDIGDKVKNVELAELRREPGKYTAEWVAPADVNAIGVNLYGHLKVGQQEAEVAQSEQPVVIDTTPPTIGDVVPEDGGLLRNNQPNILALIDDANGSGMEETGGSLELFVNGRRRALEYKATKRVLSAVPQPLPDGDVELIARATDQAGNTAEKSWHFTVATAGGPAIAVRHDATQPLGSGETLKVTLTGPRGGTATFDVGDLATGLAMTEDARTPGRYDGSYRVPSLPQGQEVRIVGHLKPRVGQELAAEATADVTLLPGELPAPTIAAPTEGQSVREASLHVQGTSLPNARVKIRLEYTAKGRITGLPYAGVLADTEVTADADGNFRSEPISLAIPVLLPRDVKYKLTAATLGPNEEASAPTTVNFLAGR